MCDRPSIAARPLPPPPSPRPPSHSPYRWTDFPVALQVAAAITKFASDTRASIFTYLFLGLAALTLAQPLLVEGMRHYTTFQMHAAATSLVNGCNMPAGSTGLEIDTGASGKPASTR